MNKTERESNISSKKSVLHSLKLYQIFVGWIGKQNNEHNWKQEWLSVGVTNSIRLKSSIHNVDRLGYPKWIEDEKKIDQYYQDLILSPNNDPIVNTMLVRKFQKQQNFKKLVSTSSISMKGCMGRYVGSTTRSGRMDDDSDRCQCLLCTVEEYDYISSGNFAETVWNRMYVFLSHRVGLDFSMPIFLFHSILDRSHRLLAVSTI